VNFSIAGQFHPQFLHLWSIVQRDQIPNCTDNY
jgi:hypothetical protein